VYCAGNRSTSIRGLFRVDGATGTSPSVTNLNAGLIAQGYPTSFPKITDIAVNPTNSAQVWITVGGFVEGVKVFFSSNAGADWTNLSGSLPNLPAHSIITDASGNTYVGTDIGVFYRNNTMNDWTPFYNDLPRVAVTGLEFLDIFNAADPANPFKYIYASTFGRGIWRSQIYENCSSALNLTQTLQGQQSFQVVNSLTSTSLVSGGVGTDVYFQSGNSITLTPGFQAFEGSEFKSIIRRCNSGPLYPAKTAILNEQTGTVINGSAETFGKIEEVIAAPTTVALQLKINTPGEYSLYLTDANGRLQKIIFNNRELKQGRQENNLLLSGLSKGFYHVQLFYGDELIHVQELEIK
jgi:hypothetical protein